MHRYRRVILGLAIILLAGVAPARTGDTSGVRTRTVWVRGNVYRVQLFLSASRDEADAVADRLRSQFPDQTVKVLFQTPFHKVRVGDFPSQAAARQFLGQAREVGYAEGMIVPQRGRFLRRVTVRQPPVVAAAEPVDEEPASAIESGPAPEAPPQVLVLRRKDATPVAAAASETAAEERPGALRTLLAVTAGLALVAAVLLFI